ncbi:MAG: glycosyltransferase, partial [Candidatus Paceibacterota bacterium]
MYLKELQKLRNQTWDKNTIPLVSIACTTYNHQSYIEKCLNSFLDQKTTFPVEIIIHDDASGDDTQKLISNFEPKYPQLFKKILQTDNQYSQGVKPFYKFIFPIVRGEYIAFCEGDDYWTDPLKLQRQVEFLESNHECSMCCTNYTEVNESGKVVNKYGWGKEKRNTRITNLMVLQYYTPKFLTSIIRQKALTVDLFHEIQKVPNGDNFLFAAVTKKGPAAYL